MVRLRLTRNERPMDNCQGDQPHDEGDNEVAREIDHIMNVL